MSILAQASRRDTLFSWSWVSEHLDDIWTRTTEHIQLTVVALVIGFVVSLALSLLAVRHRRTFGPITWIGSILYTIPSIALFGMLIPVTGLGFWTAEIALVSYTILIFVRNIVAGIDGVPGSVVEAADGMGYTRWHRLWSIELPLALPTIVAGVRIAAVTVIGLVTVAAVVGNGGYGAFILDGLNRDFPTPIVLGAGLSVALATVVDVLLAMTQRALTPWASRRGA
ncbi:MAG: ABC transporter permease [Acidimicrobiales bacterium]